MAINRALAPTLLTLVVAALAPTAQAAPKSPIQSPTASTPAQALDKLLAASRTERARKGLGLPGYKQLLGKKWATSIAKSDAAFVKQIAKPTPNGRAERITGDPSDPDPLGAGDAIKGRNAKQTRKLRIATALDSGCPVYLRNDGGWTIHGTARGEYVITTIERVGRYDVTTQVIMDVRFRINAHPGRDGTLDGGAGRDGEIAVTRQQTARDRKTGKTKKTGPTQKLTESLSPLLILDGDFDEFVDRQDGDESPAPRRPLRTSVWDDIAQGFVALVYTSIYRDLEEAERRIQTPNTCVTLSFEAPERLAPNQKIGLIGRPHLVTGSAPQAELLEDSTVTKVELVNDQGQRVDLHGGPYDAFTADKPWYDFTAPPAAWPEELPAGVRFTYASYAGVAEAAVSFKPLESKLFFKVIGVTGTVDSTDATTTSGQCTFTGGPMHIDLGAGTQTGATQGHLDGDFGQILTPITHTTQPYSTQHSCGNTPKTCDFGTEPLPNQQLGVNLRQTGDGKVNLSWNFVAVQLGNSACGLQVPDIYVDRDQLETTLPLSDFQSTQPFTIAVTGNQQYSVREGISTHTGKLRWNFQITLQRVMKDGGGL